jgi:hypothetical protein
MKRKPKTLRTKETPHFDPLPFRRGEENPAVPIRVSAVADERVHSSFSLVGLLGETSAMVGVSTCALRHLDTPILHHSITPLPPSFHRPNNPLPHHPTSP